jgi:hypothetical protein
MEKIGYALVELATGEIAALAHALPCRLTVPGVGVVDFDQPGQIMPDSANPTHIFVERWASGPASPGDVLVSESSEYDDVEGRVVVTREWETPAITKQQLIDYAAATRRALTNGAALMDVGERSIPVWVDPESRGSILGLQVASGIIEGLTAPWKGADGAFYLLTAAEIQALALGMMAFVQDCFTAEAIVLSGIEADAIVATSAIDAATWPQGWEA